MPNSLGEQSLPAYVAVRAADDRRHVAARTPSWTALDWAVVLYAMFVALVAVVWAVPQWPYILTGHAALVIGLLWLPSRGAAWEELLPGESLWRSSARRTVRFFRYTYPALLLALFFEEVSLTVNAAAAGAPFWFEQYLYEADRMLFGGVPAVMLSQAGNAVLDEVMHGFHFSYYILIIGGIILAWNGEHRTGNTPGAWIPDGDDVHDAGLLPLLCVVPVPARAGAVGTPRCHGGPSSVRQRLDFHTHAEADHGGRGGLGRMLPERARLRNLGADVRPVRRESQGRGV